MSWSIYATGTPAKVREKVIAAKQTFNDPLEAKEFETAKNLIVERIDQVKLDPSQGPWAPNAIKLEASGSSYGIGSGASLKIELSGVRLDI